MVRLETGTKIRTANRHFFENSGIRMNRTQKQQPYTILRPTKTRMNADVAFTAEELLNLPENTKILSQWKGKSRSDVYCFSVRQFRQHITEYPRKATQKI